MDELVNLRFFDTVLNGHFCYSTSFFVPYSFNIVLTQVNIVSGGSVDPELLTVNKVGNYIRLYGAESALALAGKEVSVHFKYVKN